MVLYLAPLRGITDAMFRTILATHFKGYDFSLAPFVTSVRGETINPSHVKDLAPQKNAILPVIPQIIGNNPQEFVVLARHFFNMGYTTVNWNIGCPFPQVTKKKRGSGLLPYPDKIAAFLEYVFSHLQGNVSVKTRLGLVSKDEMEKTIPVFNQFPCAEIIVHPRTAKQMYTGTVDLEAFSLFLSLSKHPVVYNGDIVSREFFTKVSTLFPTVSRWMIGRGAIAFPMLAESIRGIASNADAMGNRIKRFHDDLAQANLERLKNRGNALNTMKGIWLYLSHSMTDRTTALKRIQKSKSWEQYLKVVEDIVNPSSTG